MTDPAFLPLALTPERVESVQLPDGDYVSPGFWVVRPDAAFEHLSLGNREQATWQYFRREIAHNWYVDTRAPSVGFVNRDEASLLFNAARLFAGERCVEIGCWRGWSAAHIAAAAVDLDVVDPALSDPVWREDVLGSLQRAGVAGHVMLYADRSPEDIGRIAESDPRPWSFAFIDGDHEGTAPASDAAAVLPHMAENALILFHDLSAPAVADALVYLRSQGWKTLVYQTAQIMGAAWRGQVTPPWHRADPVQPWTLPSHLRSFGISGETAAERAERLGSVIQSLAEAGDLAPPLRPTLVPAGATDDAGAAELEQAKAELEAARESTETNSRALAELQADRDRYFEFYKRHNEQGVELAAALDEVRGQLDTQRAAHEQAADEAQRRFDILQQTFVSAQQEAEHERSSLRDELGRAEIIAVEMREQNQRELEHQALKTKAQFKRFSGKWAELEHRALTSERTCSVLEQKAASLRDRLVSTELQRNRLLVRTEIEQSDRRSEQAELKGTIASLRERLITTELKRNRLTSQSHIERARLEQLAREVERLAAETRSATERATSAETRLEQSVSALETSRKRERRAWHYRLLGLLRR